MDLGSARNPHVLRVRSGFSALSVSKLAAPITPTGIGSKTAGISATITQLLGVSEPALFGIVMQSGLRAIMVMLTSSALGGMILSLLSIKANSYGLAVLLSPLMYLYDRYQFITYITVGIAVFIFAFILTFILVKTNKTAKEA